MTTNPDSDAIRSLAAYLNPLAAFIAFLRLSPAWINRSLTLASRLLVVFIVLGLAQFAGLLEPFEEYLQALVPRAAGGALSETGRGVTLISTEPSRAGVELTLLYFMWRLGFGRQRYGIFIDVAFLAYMALVIRAAQPMGFAIVVIGLLIVRKPVQIIPFVIAALLAPLVEVGTGDSRVLYLLSNLSLQGSFSDILLLLVDAAGPRLISIYAFFQSGIFNPLGMGVGNWQESSIIALDATGFDFRTISYFQVLGFGDSIAVRGSGLLTNLMLDVGIVGSVLFLYWIFAVTRGIRFKDRDTWIIMIVLLLKVSLVGSVGEPLPWVAAAILLKANAMRHRARARARYKVAEQDKHEVAEQL
ncbi:hypothetical protein ACXYL9_02050 [Qipengyuania sp. CAU 1752]